MSSQAFTNLQTRMRDIEQLMEAHKVLTQMQKARKAAGNIGGNIGKISDVIESLVTDPGKGRRKEVEPLNRSAFVLLCAHLQGFIEDLHKEAANIILAGRVNNIDNVVKQAKLGNANPHADIIEKMFNGIGIFEVMDDIVWQKTSNKSVRKRLTDYITIRNRVAHGNQESISKQKVVQFKDFVERLAQKLDEKINSQIKSFTGTSPW